VTDMGAPFASTDAALLGQGGGSPFPSVLPVYPAPAAPEMIWRCLAGVWMLVPKSVVRGPYLEK